MFKKLIAKRIFYAIIYARNTSKVYKQKYKAYSFDNVEQDDKR